MAEWLLILLLFAAVSLVSYLAYQVGNHRGYDRGYSDSSDVGRQLEQVMRWTHSPPCPPEPPTPPAA